MPAGVIVGTLKSVTGKAFARDESGNIRPLRSGDSVHEGETLVTGQGARAELVFVDASSLAIGEGRTIDEGQREGTSPVPPMGGTFSNSADGVVTSWCPEGDLNPHAR